MKKSEKLNISFQKSKGSIRDRLLNGDLSLIHENLSSNNSLGCVLAIGACVKNNINDKTTIDLLSDLFDSKMVEFGNQISDYAVAAYHLLSKTKYLGDNSNILSLIESNFSFVR